mmetsp:Transcript_18024/g.60797  ORF Transcript_18024/g.60797 Transcript_18024/m.60797 type:complete len:206 (+) Transcript_18024:118-735(+)
MASRSDAKFGAFQRDEAKASAASESKDESSSAKDCGPSSAKGCADEAESPNRHAREASRGVAPEKRDADYWSGVDGLLRRATAHVYRCIIASENEGGLREWLDERCPPFFGTSKNDEQRNDFFILFQEFEAKIGASLEAFVASEFGPEERDAKMRELTQQIRSGLDQGPRAARSLDASLTMLLAAADYHKFCGIMRQRAKEARKR